MGIFDDVQRHQLISQDQIVQTFEPQLTPLQQQVLDLLHIPGRLHLTPPKWGAISTARSAERQL